MYKQKTSVKFTTFVAIKIERKKKLSSRKWYTCTIFTFNILNYYNQEALEKPFFSEKIIIICMKKCLFFEIICYNVVNFTEIDSKKK